MKRIYNFMAVMASVLLLSLNSCSNNDNDPTVDELAGISKFKEVNTDLHTIELFSPSGNLEQGYNEVAVRIKNNASGKYIKDAELSWLPMMHMEMMNHSCPNSTLEKLTLNGTVYQGYIVFQMPQNATEYWDLQLNYTIDGAIYTNTIAIDVPASADRNVSTFTGTDGVKYIVALAKPKSPKVAVNDFEVFIFKMQDMMHFPIVDGYSLQIDPRMPSMGNHGSPNNVAATQQSSGTLYNGKMSLTMTGYWKINLQLLAPDGTILKGESLSDAVQESSLYFDFEF